MSGVKYKIRISGLNTAPGSIPVAALRGICESLVEGAGRALRLSIQGVSLHRGKSPIWQKQATEFTITGIEKGSTVLEVEAPRLREAIPEQIAQQNFWYTVPEPEDTAVSVLSRSVTDAVSGKVESDKYDRGVLNALIALKPILSEYATDCRITSDERPADGFSLSGSILNDLAEVRKETPEPSAVVLSGLFDLIEHSYGKFRLDVEGGGKISGAIDTTLVDIEEMRSFWGRKATIKGVGHFTASGRVRFIEAQLIKPFEAGEEIFEKIPQVKRLPLLLTKAYGPPAPMAKSPLAKLWGKWPGDEPINELMNSLKEMSAED